MESNRNIAFSSFLPSSIVIDLRRPFLQSRAPIDRSLCPTHFRGTALPPFHPIIPILPSFLPLSLLSDSITISQKTFCILRVMDGGHGGKMMGIEERGSEPSRFEILKCPKPSHFRESVSSGGEFFCKGDWWQGSLSEGADRYFISSDLFCHTKWI